MFIFAVDTVDMALDWAEKTSAVVDLGKVVAHVPDLIALIGAGKFIHHHATKAKRE